jgi:hypothetical protein
MHFSIIFLSFALVVAAKDANKTLSEKGQCREITQLTKLVDLANNSTKLNLVTKGKNFKNL